MIAYHIDRRCSLQKGQTLLLDTNCQLGNAFNIYNNSLSHHGKYYLSTNLPPSLEPGFLQINGSFVWEFALEYIRCLNFPKLPSRFQCIFGCQALEDTEMWKNYFLSTGYTKMNIVKIETDNVFLGDANWFSQKGLYSHFKTDKFGNISFSAYCYYANKYWSGEMTDNPKKELLITLPCNVIDIL